MSPNGNVSFRSVISKIHSIEKSAGVLLLDSIIICLSTFLFMLYHYVDGSMKVVLSIQFYKFHSERQVI